MKWRCTVCGYLHEGAEPPDKCPVCGAPKERFEKLDEGDDLFKIVDSNTLGVAKGTEFEEELRLQFQGECAEVGLYLAMARQAEREGFAEIAETFSRIALEEAQHAARFCELYGGISKDTKENLTKMLIGECGSNASKKSIATRSKQQNHDEVHDSVHEMCRDEARHASALNGLLKRYFS